MNQALDSEGVVDWRSNVELSKIIETVRPPEELTNAFDTEDVENHLNCGFVGMPEFGTVDLQLGEPHGELQFVHIASGDQELLYDSDSGTYALAEHDSDRGNWTVLDVGSNIKMTNVDYLKAPGTSAMGEMWIVRGIRKRLESAEILGLVDEDVTVSNGVLKVSSVEDGSEWAKADFELTD